MAEVLNENIIRKIQNLLNLANGTHEGGEQEAASAMAKAQELLAKYNLELAEVQAKVVRGGAAAAAPQKREHVGIKKSAMYEWQRKLCKTIAESNFCYYWMQHTSEPYNKRYSWGTEVCHRKVKRHLILGTEANTIAVRSMYEYLVETIERILPYPNTERLSRSAINWREGCSDRLMQRILDKYTKMREAADEAKATPGSSTAITLVDVDKQEYAANYDACYGEGAHARQALARAERDAKWRQEATERDAARQLLLASETPAQRQKREQEELAEQQKAQAEWDKWYQREQRKRQREWESKDHAAYHKGAEAGKTINLNDQLEGE